MFVCFCLFVCLFVFPNCHPWREELRGKVWMAWLNCLTASCLARGTGAARDHRRCGKRETIQYLKLHRHTRMTPALKMGSDERHLNISLNVTGKVANTVSINHNFWRERRGKRNQTEVLLLTSQTPYRWAKALQNGRASTVRLPYVTLSVILLTLT